MVTSRKIFPLARVAPRFLAVCSTAQMRATENCVKNEYEVLRRQGLLESIHCLDSDEVLSPGQAGEIDRVSRQYPHLTDDTFVAETRDQ